MIRKQAGQQEMAEVIGCERKLDAGGISLERIEAGPGIIDKNINPRVLLLYLLRRGSDFGKVRHVGAYERGGILSVKLADLSRHGASLGLISADEDYLRASAGKSEGYRPAYPRGRSGDETYLVVRGSRFFRLLHAESRPVVKGCARSENTGT